METVRKLSTDTQALSCNGAAVLGRLFRTDEPFRPEEALPAVQALHAMAPDLFGKWLTTPEAFAAEWNVEIERLVGPAGGLSLEESVYKPWTTDPSHPLAGKTGFTRGDPAAHMEAVLAACGVCWDSDDRPPDHLSVLLEFLGLLMETGQARAVGPFCTDHLDWLGTLAAQARLQAAEPVFMAVLESAERLVENVGIVRKKG
ncbi:MAG: molecular chaperone TorD family protein [Thermodesulfobacteriota bacterium]